MCSKETLRLWDSLSLVLVPIHDSWQPGFHLSPGDTCSASLSATPMATEEMWKAGGGWKVGHPQQGASSGSRILHISIMLYPFQTILRGVQAWDVKHFTFGGNPKQKGDVERCGKRIFLVHLHGSRVTNAAWISDKLPHLQCLLQLQASKSMFCRSIRPMAPWHHGSSAEEGPTKGRYSPIAPIASWRCPENVQSQDL